MNRWQVLAGGVLLGLLWLLVLAVLSKMFAWGPWFWRALTITTATLTVACVIRILRPQRNLLAGICGALTGVACWGFWLVVSGRLDRWWHAPEVMVDEIRWHLLVDTAPLETVGSLEDLLLVGVMLAATVTTLIFVGRGQPLFAGVFAALLLLIPSAATGESIGWPALAGAGLLLALLAWLGSPSPNRTGIIAVALAIVFAGGAMAIAPPTQDRVWTDSPLPSPFSDTAPDVTIALAENLRQRGSSSAFTFTSTEPGPYRFTLATLSEFEQGRWQPQEELDDRGLVVSDPRSETQLKPEPSAMPAPPAALVTVSINGLLSNWLPLPQHTVRVTESEESSGFDTTQWRWTSDANTARSRDRATLRGHRYIAEVERLDTTPLTATELPEDAGDLIEDADRAPADLAVYLELPDGLPTAIAEVSERVAGTAGDRLAVGQALEDWFRRGGGFTYDESAPYRPGVGSDDPFEVIEAFLEDRHGFCVHFAAAFAVMARHLGAPSRVAVGYASRATDEDATVVRGRELHAWPEIYVADTGWVTFEPTPGGAGVRSLNPGEVPPTPEDLPAADAGVQEGSSPEDSETSVDEEAAEGESGRSETGASAESGRLGAIVAVIAALGAVALICAPAAIRHMRSRRRRRAIGRGDDPATHAWSELRDTATDLGLFEPAPGQPLPRAQTPVALVDHLVERRALSTNGATAAYLLADRMSAERYGNGNPAGEVDIDAILKVAVTSLKAGSSRGALLRAGLLPRSLRRRG